MSLRQSFANTMRQIGMTDERLVVLVGDISHGILQPYAESCPDRYYNIGICEPSIVNMASGLSEVGLIPVVHTIAPFLIERSYEQIKLDFGYQKRGVNLISVGSAFDYSKLGCSHHCYTDVSLISHIEGSQVFVPGSAYEFESLFNSTYDSNCINYFRLTENPHGQDTSKWNIAVGEGIIVKEGKDITVVTTGAQLENAVKAAEILESQNINVEILYFPTLKPFDSDLVNNSVSKTKNMITLEEISAQDGLYNLCLKSINGVNKVNSYQMAIEGFIHGYGSYKDLCETAGLNSANLVRVTKNLLGRM